MSSIFFSRIASLHKFCFVLFECFHIRSCCSIFNDQPQPHPVRRDSLYIIPHSFPFVNTFFKSFFAFFKVFFKRFMRSYLAAFLGSFIIIPLSSLFVNPFSETFLTLAALSMCTVFALENCARCTTECRASCIQGYFTIYFQRIIQIKPPLPSLITRSSVSESFCLDSSGICSSFE